MFTEHNLFCGIDILKEYLAKVSLHIDPKYVK